MSKFGVLVMGPAGSGKVSQLALRMGHRYPVELTVAAKTTCCTALIEHLQNCRRSCFYVNLDPAASDFSYEPDLDITDLISLDDVMEELSLGPNGGLIYCFEFLLQNLDFLTTAIEPLTEEYLIIFDLPGQIELYTHIPLLPTLIQHLSRSGPLNISLCAAYLLEATFVIDRAKFFAGTLSAMSAMIMLELPHFNILSKMDLVKDVVGRKELQRFVDPDQALLDDDDTGRRSAAHTVDTRDPGEMDTIMSGGSYQKLNRAVAKLIEDFSMVSFLRLDLQEEEGIGDILSYIDDAIQYHEAQEPREMREVEAAEPAWEA